MQRHIVKLTAAIVAMIALSGCSTTGSYAPNSMISAAEFDAMINIEVRELEPLPVEQAIVAVH